MRRSRGVGDPTQRPVSDLRSRQRRETCAGAEARDIFRVLRKREVEVGADDRHAAVRSEHDSGSCGFPAFRPRSPLVEAALR